MAQVVIFNGVDISTLNPHNFHLKNDYIDNLLSTAFLIFPKLKSIFGNTSVRIEKAFLSASYVRNNFTTITDNLLAHTKGLAVEFTWEGFDNDSATQVALHLYDAIKEPVLIIIKTFSNRLYVRRNVKEKKILEYNSTNEKRVIRIDKLED